MLTVLGQISFMPVLVLAAKVCPEGVEASLFAALMSVLNSGSTVSGLLGSGLTAGLGVTSEHFDNLALLTAICSLSGLLPLPLLKLIPEEVDGDEEHSPSAAQEPDSGRLGDSNSPPKSD